MPNANGDRASASFITSVKLLDGSGETTAMTWSSVFFSFQGVMLLYCCVTVWFNVRRMSWMMLMLLFALLILGELLASLQSKQSESWTPFERNFWSQTQWSDRDTAERLEMEFE